MDDRKNERPTVEEIMETENVISTLISIRCIHSAKELLYRESRRDRHCDGMMEAGQCRKKVSGHRPSDPCPTHHPCAFP
jgi:hypothetical protein